MGISDFFKVQANNKTVQDLSREVKLSELKDTTVCIDALHSIYSALLAMSRVDSLMHNGHTTVHINTTFARIIQYACAGLKQIWIFDSSTPNELKKLEIEKRNKRAENAIERNAQSKSPKEIQELKSAFKISSRHIKEIQELLNYMGIAWIEAPCGIEAEQFGAWMTHGKPHERVYEYMISGDSDVLAFGGNLLRPMQKKSASGKSKKTVYMAYEYHDILEHFNLTPEELRKLAVMLGTDFNEKTRGVGPKTAVKKAKNNPDLTEHQKKIMDYYAQKPTEIEKPEINIHEYSRNKLLGFMQEHGFQLDRINKRLDEFEKHQ